MAAGRPPPWWLTPAPTLTRRLQSDQARGRPSVKSGFFFIWRFDRAHPATDGNPIRGGIRPLHARLSALRKSGSQVRGGFVIRRRSPVARRNGHPHRTTKDVREGCGSKFAMLQELRHGIAPSPPDQSGVWDFEGGTSGSPASRPQANNARRDGQEGFVFRDYVFSLTAF